MPYTYGRGAAHNTARQPARISTVRDSMETAVDGMAEALAHRMDARAALSDNGRRYRSMSLLEIGREYLELHSIDTRGMERASLLRDMLQFRSGGMSSTSDFPSLLANVANKRLRSAYDENAPSYMIWARQAPNAPDFREISVVQLSGAPDLLQVPEHGEFKYGTMKDGAEKYAVLSYGRIVGLTRQAMLNDDLRGFERLVSAFAAASRRLENRLVYSQLTANAALSDGVALFHANHGNLAGVGAKIDLTTLGAGRAAMRLQKGQQGEELDLGASYLIVPATQETLAYQYTSANYVAAVPGNINEFSAAGRTSLQPVVEAVLDANSTTAWYMAAKSSQCDTVEYCYLDGFEGPVLETKPGFEVDGISLKARLDFAAKAIDFRGVWKNPGA
jgi:hypothetical protein